MTKDEAKYLTIEDGRRLEARIEAVESVAVALCDLTGVKIKLVEAWRRTAINADSTPQQIIDAGRVLLHSSQGRRRST